MGRLAKTAKSRLARGALKARLWEISWMARKRFWFAVAPMMYAVRRNRRERTGASRKSAAQVNCNATTASTKYFVNGSGPQSLVTWEEVS